MQTIQRQDMLQPTQKAEPATVAVRSIEKLAKAGEILDIRMIDHIIIAGGTGEMYSFREHGLMDQIYRSARSEINER